MLSIDALLKNCTLPSAFYRGTRQSNILPSAALGKNKALDKGGFAECQALGKGGFAECQALGKA